MAQEHMDPELFADFIIEAKEHLETIEPNLLELEKSPDNLSLLNEIFRPMHSLKGASGFLGLNKINKLAHKSENILDELRKGEMPVTSEIMDIILTATDTLRGMIDHLEIDGSEGDMDIDPLVGTLESLLAGEPTPPDSEQSPSDEEPLSMDFAPSAPEPEHIVSRQSDSSKTPVIPPKEDLEGLPPYELTAFGEAHLKDFLEEAKEIVESLNSCLLELEQDTGSGGELVNDVFRYFHNLKGNSGIIGFKELNSLTHEAETLLNKVRKGEMKTSQGLIDVLLASVDIIEALIGGVDSASGRVASLDISPVVVVLQNASPQDFEKILVSNARNGAAKQPAKDEVPEPERGPEVESVETVESVDENLQLPPEPPSIPEEKPEPAPAPVQSPTPTTEQPAEAGNSLPYDPEDVNIFENTVVQQLENIDLALKRLREDSSQRDYTDGLYRSLVTIQNSSGYMGLEEVKVYAERTAGLVDQSRKSGVDIGELLDLLDQEYGILGDMIFKEISNIQTILREGVAPQPAEAEEIVPEPPVEEKPAEPEPTTPAQAQEPAPPEKKAPEPEPAPQQPPPAAEAQAPTEKPKAAPKPPTPAAQPKPKVSSTIRVDHEKLDNLMNLIGELIINRNRFSMLARHLDEIEDVEEVGDIAHSLTETTYSMARISDELQATIMNVRMVPVQTVFSRFPRLVRDLSRKSGKKVELITEGEDTELDKSVVEVIGDPLVHLIRNSMDHGLEPEEERVKTGKSAVGRVYLRAYYKGNSVAIEIEDDGRGIDPEKMKKVALKKNILTQEEAKNLDDREAVELIFAPGFSSAEQVTDISGRGVGMDVVRTNIKNLKGTININSEVGKGTKFTLTLPLTLAIIDALMVTVSGETLAIPLDAVSETTKIEAHRLTEVNNRRAIRMRDEVLGIIDLCDLLELPPANGDRDILPTVVIHDNDRRLGLVVDRLLERQEIVIKPLGNYLGDQKGLSGATIMGDGSVVLILDPHEIYLMATSKAHT